MVLLAMPSKLLPLVKLHTLHGSVVPAGVIVLLGFCNPPRQGRGEPDKPGLCIPLCGFLAMIQLVRYRGHEGVGSIAGSLESRVTCCDRQD
jgi:hypothetical protein